MRWVVVLALLFWGSVAGAQATPTATRTQTATPTPTETRTPHYACAQPTPIGWGHCAYWTVTPTVTPTATATEPPCPYTFGTNTGALGKTCLFTTTCRPGNGCGYTNNTCLAAQAPMDGYFSGDGNHVSITLSTQPAVTWVGRVGAIPTTAGLQGYHIGTGPLVVFPATGTLVNSTSAHPLLEIRPASGSPYNICASPQGCTWDQSCPFTNYVGNFVQVMSGTMPPPENFLMPVPP
jgi:hypothetical protein